MNQLFSFLDVIPEGVIALTAYGIGAIIALWSTDAFGPSDTVGVTKIANTINQLIAPKVVGRRRIQLNQRAYVVREDQTGIMNQLFSFLDVIPEGVIAFCWCN
jgi:hypothetical protein